LGSRRLDPRLRLEPPPLSRSRVTVAFQVNTDIGIPDDSINLVPALEAALPELAIEAVR
jgi:hypothetical protein